MRRDLLCLSDGNTISVERNEARGGGAAPAEACDNVCCLRGEEAVQTPADECVEPDQLTG